MTAHESKSRFDAIPAAACTLVVGAFTLGDNGESAKTAPIRLVARSGQPIEHYFWGRVVHDLAGMRLHKSRLAIDYVHDDKEIIGYLNHFDSESGDLIASGALVPFKDTDRATEIVYKMAQGVPYEASINFGGDGIKVQEVFEGEVTEVNGYTFEGPGIVIRDWPLRGVAVCPYGADMNTESASALANNNKSFSAAVVSAPETAKEERVMTSESVEAAVAVDTPESEAKEVTTEAAPVEGAPAEAESVEDAAPAVEAEVTQEDAPAVEAEAIPSELSRAEFTRIADEFGAEVAVQTVRDGGDYATALSIAYAAAKQHNSELEARCAELSANGSGKPAPVVEHTKTTTSLFKTGK